MENKKNWRATLKDKKYSWRFKIANMITGDRLRENLTVSLSRVQTIEEYIENWMQGDENAACLLRRARIIEDAIKDIMES